MKIKTVILCFIFSLSIQDKLLQGRHQAGRERPRPGREPREELQEFLGGLGRALERWGKGL